MSSMETREGERREIIGNVLTKCLVLAVGVEAGVSGLGVAVRFGSVRFVHERTSRAPGSALHLADVA